MKPEDKLKAKARESGLIEGSKTCAYLIRVPDALKICNEAVEQACRKQREWISVDEKLPTNDQKVIVIQNPETTATKEPLFAIFDSSDNRFLDPAGSIDGRHLSICKWVDIIYWMPLPDISESILEV